ncbi:hypothetical protein CNMCM6106_004714 [Aspergillus hiratsukae]|nr:hypothetical protein CNMCM6106_004714 [Aspergillus hiratsukae]
MGLFLDTKALQFAKFCQGHEKSDKLIENVRYMWSQNPNSTLEESFDMLEASDFISTFMLLHILDTPDTVLEWMSILRDAGFREAAEQFVEDPNDTVLHNWTSLLSRLQPYLTPFDILSLFTKDELDHDILRYFAALLAFVEHEGEPPGMNERENDVSRKLEREFDVASHVWKLYRHHGWRCGIRGEIFNEHHNFEKIASHIVQFEHDGRHGWESMIEAEKDLLAGDFQASIPHIYLMNLSTAAENIDNDRKILFTITESILQTSTGKGIAT